MNPADILRELQDDLKRLRHERDLYRAIAIEEMAEHHRWTSETAAIKIDDEMMRHLRSLIS